MVEQHDAHLVALAAVLEAGDVAVFDKTASAILAAYPQIDSINLEAPKTPAAGRYRVERVVGPNTIGMTIDAHDLLPEDTGEISVNVALPDGTLLAGAPIEDADFAQPLASQSQPLLMSASFAPRLETLFPPIPSLGIVALSLLTYAMAVIAGRQFIAARAAERQASRNALLARLEHASRVNGLGEMASGMAHELTQPLTAILSSAQASKRVLARLDVETLSDLLDDTVGQAKRASGILSRLRQWVQPQEQKLQPVALLEAVANVEDFLRSDLARLGCRLIKTHRDPGLILEADPVQLEQILFNVVRNSMDAVSAGTGKITITTRRDGSSAVIDISDNGPGIDPTIRDRLFEPFATTKEDGMGLGLALCHRLAERMGGSIALVAGTATTFRIRMPLFREDS
ncbi:MAG: sensor histidine kinase [Devosia sp.]